jgi:hypothetical protein
VQIPAAPGRDLLALRLFRRFPRELGSCFIDATCCNRGQQRVGLLFLHEGLIEKLHGILKAEQLRPRGQRAVARHLVMFGGLAGGHKAGVADGVIIDILDDLLAFGDNAEDGVALPAARLLLDQLEDFFEPVDLALGLFEMMGKSLSELLVGAVLGELGKRLRELLLGEIYVLQLRVKKFFHGLHRGGCPEHGGNRSDNYLGQ